MRPGLLWDYRTVLPMTRNESIETRVARCFTNVFPALPSSRIQGASADTLEAWDSVAHITLLTAVAEEFGIEFEPEDYVDLISYSQILDAIKARQA
jgi:acyl carrier protein